MTALTSPQFLPTVGPDSAFLPCTQSVFLQVLADWGHDLGRPYHDEYGTELSALADLRTLVHELGGQEVHCLRRLSVRCAARVALGWQVAPGARIGSAAWRALPESVRRTYRSHTGR